MDFVFIVQVIYIFRLMFFSVSILSGQFNLIRHYDPELISKKHIQAAGGVMLCLGVVNTVLFALSLILKNQTVYILDSIILCLSIITVITGNILKNCKIKKLTRS